MRSKAFLGVRPLSPDRPILALTQNGGDCAGLNAANQSIVLNAWDAGWQVVGFLRGTQGMYENKYVVLHPEDVRGWERQAGTNLLSTRETFENMPSPTEIMIANFHALNCRAWIGIGGDGSLAKTWQIARVGMIRFTGVPKTIDFDIGLTDRSIGHDTAVHIVAREISNLEGTNKSHERIMIVDTMGRHRGWIALRAAIAAKADAVIIPEINYDLREIADHLVARRRPRNEGGRGYAVLVVAEGATLSNGDHITHAHRNGHALGGIGKVLAEEIDKLTGMAACAADIVGYTQRGARPIKSDRELGKNMGAHAVQCILEGKSGVMVSSDNGTLRDVPIDNALAYKHTIDEGHPLVQKATANGIFMNSGIARPVAIKRRQARRRVLAAAA